jgi:saccharopine dehydrogenase-like NADP-dependent oxidoreductase
MRALVLGGAGAVCTETTRDLAASSDFEEIVVADANLTAVEQLISDIGDLRLKATAFDADNFDGMLALFPGFDVVVNGLPFKYDLAVTQACVQVGVNGLDLSSEDGQFALHEEAISKGITFVPGVGATPGTTNMMVAHAAERLDRMDEVQIDFAAFRALAPAPGLLTTTIWEFDPEEEAREEVYFEAGEFHPSPPLSGEKTVRFHEHIGEQRVYFVPHNENYTLPASYPALSKVSVRGCFPPEVMEIMGAMMRGGMLGQSPIDVDGDSMPAIDAARALLWQLPFYKDTSVWAYGLLVEVTGELDGKPLTHKYSNHHPPQTEWGGQSAYYKNVGIPTSIGAQMIAHGEVSGAGVLAPELAFPVEPFFTALAERGVTIEHTVEEATAG